MASPWPYHDMMSQQVLGHQPSQAAVGQQTNECHDTGWPPALTTSGGAPPPLPVLGWEWKTKVLEAEGAPPPMEVQAEAAAPPWTAADDGKIQTFMANGMMKKLHSQGQTAKDLKECLERTALDLCIVAAIQATHAKGVDFLDHPICPKSVATCC
ncbi:hypothetical protein CJ030_MR6G018848 [Morella rubra]|uniref:Uncharacterized protein n=1 Tax=Morella rubra TaxID=262757 RepID=A0A6A1V9F1_9ROSI|nr:hypothetical protein CJ030_MR6G018848 [Morella rubra]